MAVKKTAKKRVNSKCQIMDNCSSPSCVWFLGFIGAAIYNISVSVGFWSGVLGVIKALVWPAFLVFKIMQYLGM
ncbi:hypothetical protein HOF78_01355 [Candidatus Woesearchaeota archaeon]|jgi:hypothetical protein|nr:hypothetical protein [Candidatus Woesearchaeota archaeon]MBT6044969.1 hypothetical protein [Candidatus Woesearchaeota archaeon]